VKSWKRPPRDSYIARYVECYWVLEKENDDVGKIYPKLNPDPAAHLVLALDEQKYQYTQDETQQKEHGCHWIFQHKKTYTMDHSQPFLIIGIKFQVGALYSLNDICSQSNLDNVVNVCFNELIQSDTFELSTLLAQAVEFPEQVCNVLDQLLLPWLLGSHGDKHSDLIHRALPLLKNTPIAQIGKSLHCSQRTIERAFLRVTKLTLKQYQSMTRLEEMLNYLYSLEGTSINWVDVATKFKFSDQPHLIRYLKNAIGTTPGGYAKQRDLAIDIYGDFE
jgi:AraC-like DNA-binding protein